MAENELQSCAYHIVRYAPNLVRDEWINIGVVLFDPTSGRVVRRLVEEPGEFARVRRLHPTADEDFLRNLGGVFDAPRNGDRANGLAWLGKLEETLSNTIQLSPRTSRPSSIVSTASKSSRRAPAAPMSAKFARAATFARARRIFCAWKDCSAASSAACAWRTTPIPAIP